LSNKAKISRFKSFVRMFVKLVRMQPIHIFILTFLSAMQGLLPAFDVYVIARISIEIVQSFYSGFNYHAIRWLLVLLLSRTGNEIVGYFSQKMSLMVKRKAAMELKEDMIEKIISTDLRQREKREFSDIINRAQKAIDPYHLTYLFERLPLFFTQFLKAVSLCLLLLFIHWALPFINLGVLFACAYLQFKLSKYYFNDFRRSSKEERLLGAYSSVLISKNTVSELRVLKRYDWMMTKWRNLNLDFKRKRRSKHYVRELAGKAIEFVLQHGLPVLSILIVLISRNVSLQNVIISMQSSIALAGAVYYMVFDFTSFSDSIELYTDYFNFFDQRKEVHLGTPVESSGIEVECRNVSFSYYENDILALNNVSLKIRPGEKIVLVGENGSGKTTLAKLILGLYNPSSGEITLGKGLLKDGQSPKITAVFQDFTKYLLTLRHNVGYGETAFMNNDDKIYEVLENVNLSENDYYMKLDEQLGPQFGGRDFSQGQWQKIAVARGSLRKNHGISVLDEPTASLDPITESRMIQSFIDLIGGSTCIFVSHRLSSVKLADRIIVIKAGRIIEEGTHKELMALGGEYYRMFHEQAKLYD